VISKKLLGIKPGRSLRGGSRLPLEGRGGQAPCDAAVHEIDRKRPGGRAEGDRVEHGDGVVMKVIVRRFRLKPRIGAALARDPAPFGVGLRKHTRRVGLTARWRRPYTRTWLGEKSYASGHFVDPGRRSGHSLVSADEIAQQAGRADRRKNTG